MTHTVFGTYYIYNKDSMIVYKTTNLKTGKYYIGQDKNNDPNYFGSGRVLNQAIKKYGRQNFKKEILEYCNSKKELDLREQYWIETLNAIELGYNITKGGTGGDTITNHPDKELITTKRIESIRKKFSSMDEDEKKKKFSTPEKRKKLSEAQKSRMQDPSIRAKSGRSGKDHWAYGKSQSSETIEKRMKTWKYTPPQSGKFAPRRIIVTDSTGIEQLFDSIRDVARHFNWSVDSIRYILSKNKNTGSDIRKESYKIEYYNSL